MSSRRSIGSERGLQLLSIDGGGIRGLSPLIMLREILYRIQQEERLPELPRPCDVFDLAGGTSTGGLIVIMLFRLRMSIDEAITSYADLARRVFSVQKWFFKDGKFKASRLEEAIVIIIQKALGINEADARSVRMLDEKRTRCFVCATPAENVSFPSLFRTWIPAANRTYNCTIVEAARATSAAPTFFKSIEFGEPIKQRYLDGGLGCNNPVKQVIDEARSLYPNRPISCVISLGTGAANVIGMERPDAFQNLLPMNLIAVLKGIATDCENISEQIARDLSAQAILYVRLNVDQGLQGVSLAEWEKLSAVQLHTLQYLQKYEVGQKVDHLVRVLKTSGMTLATTPTVPTITLSAVERDAFDKLEKSIASSAYHDSQARSSSSPCLPGTRQDQIEKLTTWIETRDQKKSLFVVLGPAGSGKTSLLNTIAQICKEKGFYAGGFFFSGTGTNRSNNEARFINTITYQIAETIPELRPYVARVVAAEPSILGRSLDSQTRRLLLEPLRQLWSHHPYLSLSPRILLIDALDECGGSEDQHHVINALAELLSDESFPFFCVLSSRFNLRIEHEIANTLLPHVHDRVILGRDDDSEGADIKKYLRASILHIRRDHVFGMRIPPECPTESDLTTIVKRSGGQFIYAATVVKHIKSPEHNPYDRLKSILAMTTNPGAALDSLYQNLMSSVTNTEAALEILGIHLVKSHAQYWTPDTLRYLYVDFFIKHFHTLDADVVLAPLASVLRCENGVIEVFHLTFAEFLLDETRSGEYFVHPRKWQKWIVSQLVPFFYDRGSILPKDVEHLIKEATDLELHQAINDGLGFVADPTAQLILSRDAFNLWPFATFTFFLQLNHWTFIENMANIFSQQGESLVPLPILITHASEHKFSNSFILFELCRTCMLLQQTGFIREESWRASLDILLTSTTYLADYLQDQHQSLQSVLLPDDYLTATLRCLWYLQSTSRDIRVILQEEFNLFLMSSSLPNSLPVIFGIPDFLDDSSSNLARGAIELLPTLLLRARPSADLLTSLKQPFDSEAILRNSSSWHKATAVIHDYLMEHDNESGPSHYTSLDGHASEGEDETMPDFKVFLHRKASLNPILESISYSTID